jgi:hypothetical protein
VKASEKTFLNKSVGDVEQMIDTLTPLRDSWLEAFDGRSEKWQESDKGEKQRERIEALDASLDTLEALKDNLATAVQEDE